MFIQKYFYYLIEKIVKIVKLCYNFCMIEWNYKHVK